MWTDNDPAEIVDRDEKPAARQERRDAAESFSGLAEALVGALSDLEALLAHGTAESSVL